jgi:hypothetical protein
MSMQNAPGAPAPKPSRWTRITNWVIAMAALVTSAIALIRFFDTSLPACTASHIHSTLVSIARNQGIQEPQISDLGQTGEATDERRCSATLTNGAGATSPMLFRIYREDGKTQVSAEWRRI